MKNFKQLTIGTVLGFTMMVGGAFATPAQAVTIDFEGLMAAGTGFTTVPGPYTEDGFEISATTPADANQFISWNMGNAFFAGSTGLLINNFNAVATLEESTNAAFSLTSIDLADVTTFAPGNLVTFTAQVAGGGTTMQSFGPVFGLPFQTFNFDASFGNITSVSWVQGDGSTGHQFDNIVLGPAAAPVPEPSTMLLFGSGLAGIIAWRARKSQV